MIHAARLERSPRLRRVVALLSDGQEHSTRDIVREADVCAVSTIISELRTHGIEVDCRHTRGERGERIWFYRLASPRTEMAET